MKFNFANKIILILLVIFTCVLYTHALFFAEVWFDAGNYLGLAQQVVSGKLLYKDIINYHTPFSIYYFASVMALFGEGYSVMLFSLFVIIFLGAFILYRCLIEITNNKTLGLILAFLYLVSSYYYDAIYIYLEPFVNLFGLSSIYFLIKWEKKDLWQFLYLSGVCACLAFLSKQYGIVYIPFAGLYALNVLLLKPDFSIKTTCNNLLIVGSGAISPFLLLILTYFLMGVSPLGFLSNLVIKAYADESLSNYFITTWIFLVDNCLVFILIPILFFVQKSRVMAGNYSVFSLLILFLLLFFLLTSIYYVKVFEHYSLLILPVTFLVIASIYSGVIAIGNQKLNSAFFIFLGVSICFTTFRTFNKFLKNESYWNREKQLAIAKEINKILPPKSKVLLLNDFHYYYLCNLEPFYPEKYGYVFVGCLIPAQMNELLQHADTFLLNKSLKDTYLKNVKGKYFEIKHTDFLVFRKMD